VDLFDVTIEDQNGDLIPDDNKDGTYHVTYQPKDPGTFHIDIIYHNPSNPFYYDHLKNSTSMSKKGVGLQEYHL